MAMQSTLATIQNIRHQRLLEMELLELDRQWTIEAKALNQDRLGLLTELCRIREDQRGAEHLPLTTSGPALTALIQQAHVRDQRLKAAKELQKFHFQPDPVEKVKVGVVVVVVRVVGEVVKVNLPLAPARGQAVELRTARELEHHRVRLLRSTFQQLVAERRNRRRAFWDKALIGPRKISVQGEPRGSLTLNSRASGQLQQQQNAEPGGQTQESPRARGEQQQQEQGATTTGEEGDVVDPTITTRGSPRRSAGLSKSPSLPALNSSSTRRRPDPNSSSSSTVHPSLSNRHSASLDYLPVIKGTAARGSLVSSQQQQQQQGALTAASVSGSGSGTSAATAVALPPIVES
ncbi:uncharacterized protein LOC143298085 isoform X1 [Babylonia areolata]|uniref:uncharacterized protein LOC143298085 isoform X1 n=1 Tax=Babylonia areolata TaxID=304850 RepID=UPI003FD0351B